jgi:long-chain acyl-CoA synthetase
MNSSSTILTMRGSPFELQEQDVLGEPCLVFPRAPSNLVDVIRKSGAFADRELLVCAGDRLTFGGVVSMARICAAALQREHGVARGDPVALYMTNSVEWIVGFVAIVLAGAVAVLVHRELIAEEAAAAINSSGGRVVLTDVVRDARFASIPNCAFIGIRRISRGDGYLPAAADAAEAHMGGSRCILIRDGAQAAAPEFRDPQPPPDDIALVAFSSGTTGRPKGIILSHRNVVTGLMNMMLGSALRAVSERHERRAGATANRAQPCSLVLSPLSHISGYAQLLLAFQICGKVVLMPQWQVRSAIDLVDGEGIRTICGITAAKTRELITTHASKTQLSSLTSLQLHGSFIHPRIASEVKESLAHVSIGSGYGMTETSGSICVASEKEIAAGNWSCGKVLPSVSIRIVDESGADVQTGGEGEICIRGAMLSRHYLSDRGEFSSALVDGWLHTGDIGRVDAERRLYVVDRASTSSPRDVGGRALSAIEAAICECDGVDEAAVVEVVNRHGVARMVAAVETSLDCPDDKSRMRSEIDSQMTSLGCNCQLELFRLIPRTVSGKLDRRRIALQLAGRQAN